MTRVLVVVHDASVRKSLERGLGSAGIETVVASTVGEGIAKIDGCDVALVDLRLPDGLGTDLVRAIRQQSRPVRVAILGSGTSDAEAVVEESGERPDKVCTEAVDFERML